MVGRSTDPWYRQNHHAVKERMTVPRALAKAQIKCLIWGFDATHFIQKHRNFSFSKSLHLLVADANIQLGAKAIITSLPHFQPFTGLDSAPSSIMFDTLGPPAFPDSICLEVTSLKHSQVTNQVFLHPQSQFYFDVEDHSRSVTIRPFPDTIRFPTLAAFFDSLIAVRSDPLSGRDLMNLDHILVEWTIDHVTAALGRGRKVLPTGQLKPECLNVMESLKPENRPCFEAMARGGLLRSSSDTRLLRKEILHRLGRHEEAQRPLPLPFLLDDLSKPDIFEFVPASPTFHNQAGKQVFPTLGTMSRQIQKRSYSTLMPSSHLRSISVKTAKFNHGNTFMRFLRLLASRRGNF